MLQIIFCFLLLSPSLSYSKTTIDSDQLDINLKEKTAIFTGNVQISGNEIAFAADMVKVTFLADNRIKTITAKSNEKLINATIIREGQNYTLHCREIFIDMIKEIITASNGTFTNNNSTMTGDKIIYNIKSGKILLSGTQQVKISIEDGSKKTR